MGQGEETHRLTVGQHLPDKPPAYTERMATADASLTGLPQAEVSQALAKSWKRLTRAATAVAIITSPAVFVWFTERSGMSWTKALLLTVGLVVVFRGFADLLFRRLIPAPGDQRTNGCPWLSAWLSLPLASGR